MPRCLFALVLFASPVSAAEPTVAELVKQLETGSPGERVVAAELLGERGLAALAAADPLARAALGTKLDEQNDDGTTPPHVWADRFLFDACRVALRKMGPKAAPVLARLLRHESKYARVMVANDLGADPKSARAALPWLITCLGDPFAPLVEYAADAIGTVGPQAESAIPALASVFRGPPLDGNPEITGGIERTRKVVAAALVKIGPKAHPAIRNDILPLVAAQLNDSDPKAVAHAIGMLRILGDLGEPALPALVAHVRRAKAGIPTLLEVLASLGPAGAKAHAGLITEWATKNRAHYLWALLHATPAVAETQFARLAEIVRTGPPDDRDAARCVLLRLGPGRATDVMPLLGPTPTGYADSLVRLGDAGVRAVVGFLAHEDPAVRRDAATALAYLRGRGRHLLPALRTAAKNDPHPVAAGYAACAAAVISLDPNDLAPITTRKLLDTPDADARQWITERLDDIRPLSVGLLPRPAEPHLSDVAVRGLAFVLAWDFDATARACDRLDSSGGLGETVREYGWGFALVAAGRLTEVGPRAAVAVPTLAAALKETEHYSVRELLLDTVRALGPRAEAVPGLVAVVRSDAHLLIERALSALEAIGPAAKDAVPALVEHLDRTLWAASTAVCLGAIGPAAKAAIPRLTKLQLDPDPDVRLAATFALARIESDLPKYRATLARLSLDEAERPGRGGLFSSTPLAPELALRVFAAFPAEFPELLPVAVKYLDDRPRVVVAFKRYGVRAAAAAIREVSDAWSMNRVCVAEVLGDIDPAARDVLPKLRRFCDESTDLYAAVAARDAVRKIEGK